VDTGFISQENLDKLREGLDFTSSNNSEQRSQDKVVHGEDAMYTAYPLPLPPADYDPDYEPEYLVIHAINYTVFDALERMNKETNEEIRLIIIVSFMVGGLGMVLTTVILWYVSKGLTEPLLWIKRVAWGIVNNDDMRPEESLVLPQEDEGPKTSVWWAPRTELSELVREFRAMISGFSGDGAATLAVPETLEIPNQLTWQSVYQQLYARSSRAIDERKSIRISSVNSENASRPSSDAAPDDVASPQLEPESDEIVVNTAAPDLSETPPAAVAPPLPVVNEVTIVPAPPKKNRGPNVRKESRAKKGVFDQYGGDIRAYRSSLFWWIFLLIALPLCCSNMTICWVLSTQIIDAVGDWVGVVGDHSQSLELKALDSKATLKAAQAARSVDNVVRDLHFMTRVAGWLFFDGLPRSDSFPDMENAANECRGYDWYENVCPVQLDFERSPW